MHLASRAIAALLLLTFSNSSLAKDSAQLTKIERGSCLLFPKILDIEKQIPGVHYKADHDTMSGCETDINGNIERDTCNDMVSVDFKYRYKLVTTFDHYTNDGKLITTSTETESNEFSEMTGEYTVGDWGYDGSVYFPNDSEARDLLKELFEKAKSNMEKHITKEIYESNATVCSDSFYK